MVFNQQEILRMNKTKKSKKIKKNLITAQGFVKLKKADDSDLFIGPSLIGPIG
jgi:hypothetical protein